MKMAAVTRESSIPLVWDNNIICSLRSINYLLVNHFPNSLTFVLKLSISLLLLLHNFNNKRKNILLLKVSNIFKLYWVWYDCIGYVIRGPLVFIPDLSSATATDILKEVMAKVSALPLLRSLRLFNKFDTGRDNLHFPIFS